MSEDPLAPLRAKFRERSREDVGRLRAAAAQGESGRIDAERIIHRLAGMAAMFGFGPLGEAAAALDRRHADGEPPDWTAVAALADRIEREVVAGAPDAAA